MDFTALFTKLPWAWCVTVLCNIGWFFVCKLLWTRLNNIQDLRVADNQKYSDKYNEICQQVNATLNALAGMLRK